MKQASVLVITLTLLTTIACRREPKLHLYEGADVNFDLPIIDLDLEVYWDYEMSFDISYDWKAEWFYGWDEIDKQMFGEIGYTQPSVFNLRRYFTGEQAFGPHLNVLANQIVGTTFQGKYDWGFWDILVWNEIVTMDGVQSLIFDEESSLDSVIAYTNQTMHSSRYEAPRYTHSFNEPEALFAAYDQGIEIDRELKDFYFDEVRNVYVKKLNMVLEPITYIYLTQVILHHNNNIITSVDGSANFSGMARSINVNTGVAGSDPITIYYNVRMKKGCDMNNEQVDIIGGRLMSFGMCNHNGNLIKDTSEVKDRFRHYMDVTMQFNNGNDSTFVFDITNQVRRRYKGGVITVELDLDTIPIPGRSGGSGFEAVVVEPDSVTHEFNL